MKKVLVVTALAAMLGATVAMADHGFGGGFGGKGMDRLKTALGLSDVQASQVDVIMQEQKAKMDALREETNQRIQALLTPDQATKFAEIQQKRQERMQKAQQRMQNRPAPAAGTTF
ncbi:hypothetical protein VSS37_20190 [Candidatus Thiothrix sp. Deng01]|uniref:Zinc resistance-associated protein n=1 Tax=Candidatus Thiothrix phosphatis TaxID=3112415 RepID=A0ABU6D2K5_9GAMM|nr:hypothetical protein [Candidatus Thiothrix sp. Deng01]MEB4593309.1 hypothetical protein [Candidatus Thiothrix sp. Deng01]